MSNSTDSCPVNVQLRRSIPAAVYRYRLATGVTRWLFIIDLPTDADGRHR